MPLLGAQEQPAATLVALSRQQAQIGGDQPGSGHPSPAWRGNFSVRSRRAVAGDRMSLSRSGASSNQAVVGSADRRDRRQPARSGTRSWPPRCNWGSPETHQPPGPKSAGLPICLPNLESLRACLGVRRGAGDQAAMDDVSRPGARADRCCPGRWRVSLVAAHAYLRR